MSKPNTAIGRVSDHALVRYLERIKGIDVEAIREEIWQQCQHAANLGATGFRVNGAFFNFHNGNVATCMTAEMAKVRMIENRKRHGTAGPPK